MGYTTKHRCRKPKVVVPATGQFLNSTCIRTNQSREGIIYSAVLTERIRGNVVIQEPLDSSYHNQLYFDINIKSDKTNITQCRKDFRKGSYKEIRKSF